MIPRLAWLAVVWGFSATAVQAASPAVAAEPSPSPITNAAAVRMLTEEQAVQGLPVRLQGVVTFSFNPRSFFLQDETAGVYVGNGVGTLPLTVGDLVLVEGATHPGDYAPLVQPSRLEVLGHTNLPTPARVSFADLMTGRQDSQWVEVVGLVRAAYEEPQGQRTLEVDMGGGRVTAFLPIQPQVNLLGLVDRTVRVRGVCGTWFNKQRQLFGVRLMVPSWEDIAAEESNPADDLTQPARSIGSLLRFAPQGQAGHRVKVAGTVTLQQPGQALFLQDARHGVYVQTRQAGLLQPGDQVEVIGFPDKGEYTPVILDAIWTKTGSGPAPEPLPVRPDEALLGLQDSRLVAIEGRLLDRTHDYRGTVLVMGGEGQIFSAHLPTAGFTNALANLENGSRLRLTGVCRIEVGEDWRAGADWRAKGFRLLLRDASDVTVLSKPPWWSLRRLLWALAALAAIVLASLVWAAVLRRKVQQQTWIIRQQLEQEARLKERYRDLFEGANDMVYTHDLGGRLTSINIAGEQILRRPREQVVRQQFVDFIVEEQRPAARRWLEDIVDGAAPATVEWDFLPAGGERVRLEISTRLIDHEGREVEVEGIARDVTERSRLEREILEVSTREQRRIGHDLHDGVCQQLAGIAVLADILADKLEEKGQPAVPEARKIVDLVNQVNKQTRNVARGLFPVRLEENGLVSALEELVQSAGAIYKARCVFSCESPIVIRDPTAALHLYYIAQEAVLNAVKHGAARAIDLHLAPAGSQGCVLTVKNDGAPISPLSLRGPGMGVRIMKYRARMIGATITLNSPVGGGAEVVCRYVPEPNQDRAQRLSGNGQIH